MYYYFKNLIYQNRIKTSLVFVEKTKLAQNNCLIYSENMYKYGKFSDYKIKKILYLFSKDKTALESEKILNIHRNTINRYYNLFRESLKKYCEEVELTFDESELGIYPFKNTHLLLIFTKENQVCAEILPDSSTETLIDVLVNKIKVDCKIYTYQESTYKSLHHCEYKNCRYIGSNKIQAMIYGNNLSNVVKNLGGKIKKFYGIKKEKLPLYLKEAEFRLNNEHKNEEDLYKMMLQITTKFH